ncbi:MULTISPECIES: glycosyltransferase [Flavobacteriaceae]|uniref:glycosyltransferase n=1 Tax=Flavobacteriaceae TaxID=49546 RepID=UPI003A929282
MKILVTCHGFLTPSMTFIYNQIRALQNQGHIVEVVACERKNEHLFPLENVHIYKEKKDFNYIISAFKRKLNIDFTYFSSSFSKNFQRHIATFEPDIVHCHFGTHFFRLGDYFKRYPIPTVITFHGYDASAALTNKTYCNSLNKVFTNPLVIGTAVSKAIKANLVNIGIPSEKIIVDYLGVDIDFFKREKRREFNSNAPATFLQIANFVEKKGHQYTLKAFKKHLEATKSNDVLIFGGTGPLFEEMVQLSKKLNLQHNVKFIGLVDRFQVKELMEDAHFFVHHSITAADGDTEGLPTVLMEAMAMELPCISTFHSGIPEIIEDGLNGILNVEREIEGLSRAFNDIKAIPNIQRALILRNYNLQINTAKIENIFKTIA